MYKQLIKLGLRWALAASFLSAVADRFGWWPTEMAAWGNWNAFLAYTQVLNPLVPESWIPALGTIATAAEILFGLCLLVGFRTRLVAQGSGLLLLLFALAMTFTTGLKGPLDYSVFTAAAAAFALSTIEEKYLEIDQLSP
mgnify:CR=1 FL=1